MEAGKKEAGMICWHPAFYAGIQIELEEDADNLEFENEHQLATNPMEIDVLVIKKETGRPVKKNIGKIFRKHNIIEYKSPDDSLSVDDFYKVYGYACFYKADTPHENSISALELTITFVSEKYPRKLLRHLREVKKYTVTEAETGIYRIGGDLIPIQIIVTKKLSEKQNLWLKSLTNRLERTGSVKKLVADYMAHPENRLYESVMETIIRANRKIFKEADGMDDIVMEIVQEKFDRRLKEAVEAEMEKAVEDITKDITEKVTKDITEKVTKDTTEKVTKNITEKTRLMDWISLVQKKCMKNKTLSVIADELETEPKELISIYDVVFKNPEKTVEELYELISENS